MNYNSLDKINYADVGRAVDSNLVSVIGFIAMQQVDNTLEDSIWNIFSNKVNREVHWGIEDELLTFEIS